MLIGSAVHGDLGNSLGISTVTADDRVSRTTIEFLGQISHDCPTLSRRPLWRCTGATMVTSTFAEFEAAAYGELVKPPPPSTGVLRASLRMHRPLTSTFGRRPLCLWGPTQPLRRQHMQGGQSACGPYAAHSRLRRGWDEALPTHARSCVGSCPTQRRAWAVATVLKVRGADVLAMRLAPRASSRSGRLSAKERS